MKRIVVPGTCMHCGCTNDKPCEDADGDVCGWADEHRTVCTFCAYNDDEMIDEEIEREAYRR